LRDRKLNYREALARRLRVLKPCIVLDAGTGAGIMTKALSNGLDSSVVSIDVNKRVFPYLFGKINRNRVHFVACDFAQLPFREDTFSCVVCDLVISTSQVWNPLSIYTEFERVLKTESPLFITDYYPEKSPRTREALLAAETSKLGRIVLKARGAEVHRSVSPESSVKQLRKAGFTATKKERINANEAQEWKKRVFEEYFNGMHKAISGLENSKLKMRFTKRLEKLKSEIENHGRIRWGWAANYLIEATK
jgi:ubiquinone/menaquinone biosynthesis C-methylase UbiE